MFGASIFIAIWIIIGVIAFVYSLICIGRSGSTLEKALGVVIAMFLGPFYFLYLALEQGYCQ